MVGDRSAILQRLLIQLAVVGLLFAFLSDILLAKALSLTAFSGGTGLYTESFKAPFIWNISTVCGFFAILLSGVLSFFLGDFRRIEVKYLIAFYVLQCWMLLHAINSFWDGFTPFEPFTYKGPAVWWGCFAIFIGTDERRWNVISKVLLFLSYLSSLLILIVLVSTSFMDRYEAMRSLYGYLPVLFWTAPWVVFVFSENRRGYIAYLPFLVMVVSTVFIVTRSWMIICVMYLISFLVFKNRETPVNRRIASALLLFIISVFLLSIFYDKLSIAFDLISSRGLEDTRTEQYEYFLSQNTVWDLLFGKGPRGTYRLGRVDYGSIDGSYTLMAFNGGVVLVVTYFMLMVLPAFKTMRCRPNMEIKASAIMLVFWALALTGFSIYSLPDVSAGHYILCLYAGRCLSFLKSEKEACYPIKGLKLV